MQREKTSISDEHMNDSMPGVTPQAITGMKRQGLSTSNTAYGLAVTSGSDDGSMSDPPDVER